MSPKNDTIIVAEDERSVSEIVESKDKTLTKIMALAALAKRDSKQRDYALSEIYRLADEDDGRETKPEPSRRRKR